MRSRREVDREDEMVEKPEANEEQREDSRETMHRLIKGEEHPINDRGDTLFVSTMRPPLELALENRMISNERFFVWTKRAGHETGHASASVQIERDEDGNVSKNRTRLHDIGVGTLYRGEGYGDIMLQEVERNARRYASSEIYGLFAADNDADYARAFYERNGYRFRSASGGGEEVYKPLR
jgi:GNAT superfamily N-acetyltransferase